ncbi:hypothetical protein PoB_006441500 [Plakobranchus ocellatus]|uniref:Uncharacterized protein n=1 Tax=Plakobranchus ocellatus TaxID=259542 RepID=A0AAV4D1F4_9GAST|nr:hypothetical protein PoB_006441500 [Plakobranchus ocellatus]
MIDKMNSVTITTKSYSNSINILNDENINVFITIKINSDSTTTRNVDSNYVTTTNNSNKNSIITMNVQRRTMLPLHTRTTATASTLMMPIKYYQHQFRHQR